MSKKAIQWKYLILSLVISLGVGALSAFLTRGNMNIYKDLIKPPLSPPSWVFPVVWTILFVLMGISAYIVYVSNSSYKSSALSIYVAQLIVNMLWSIVFFNLRAYLGAFFVLVALWILIILMINKFSKISAFSAKLQIPYLLWVSFAGYLNLSIYFLNR